MPIETIKMSLLKFPVKGVEIILVDDIVKIENGFIIDEFSQFKGSMYQFELCDQLLIQLKDNQIIVKNEGCTIQFINLFLTGIVLAAYNFLNSILSLHASCFKWNNKTILICGESESGKSTTCMEFVKKGAIFISDDLTSLFFGNKNKVVTKSISSNVKLWDDAIEKLNLQKIKKLKIFPENEKYLISMNTHNLFEQIDYIFILKNETKRKLIIKEVLGVNKIKEIRNQIYRKEFIPYFKEFETKFMKHIINLALQSTIFTIRKPTIVENNRLINIILNEIN